MTEDSSINRVVASNLAYWMRERELNQTSLALKAGVSQKTISNYLNPGQRTSGSKGKEPSAKLTELSKISEALGVGVWQLLRDMNDSERELYAAIDRYTINLRKELAETGAAHGEGRRHLQPPSGTVKVVKQGATPDLRKLPHMKG